MRDGRRAPGVVDGQCRVGQGRLGHVAAAGEVDVAAVERDLASVAAELGVGVTLRAADTDEL